MPSVKYPWESWFKTLKKKGGTVLLRKGEDYDCMTHCMYIQFRAKAKKRGIKVKCQVREEGGALEIKGVK